MTTGRFDELESLAEHIWAYAERGIRLSENAMTAPAFATAGPDGPAVRTVAPRRMDRQGRWIDFHTDSRSPKLSQLDAGARACWMAWDEDLGQQFQFFGELSIHHEDAVADSLWEDQSIDNLEFYFKALAPGSAVQGPVSSIDIDTIEEDAARSNFCVLRTTIDEIIWLHLHEDGEYRARFVWEKERFQGQWIVP